MLSFQEWNNINKFYKGSLFSQNMWAAAKSFTSDKYDYHMSKIEEKSSDALDWLDDNHPHISTSTTTFQKVSIVGCQKPETCIWYKCLTT
jgi:hypothetical protein